MAFDITTMLQGVADTMAGEEQIEYIELDKIDPDENNFYSLAGLDELAANIELIGLQQPLRVRPGKDGHVTIVSGHRRRAACMMLRDGGNEKFRKVPCIRETGEASPAMQELRLIYANAATRVMTSAEVSQQAERVEMLLYQLKEEGVEFPGRMRDHVAEACRVSRTKLARLHAIRKNLGDWWLKKFDAGELSEELAYQMSRLPDEIRDEAAERLSSGKQTKLPNAYVVERVNKNLARYLESFPCRSHAGGPPCHHLNEKILKSLFAPYDWQVCDPGTCCRDCYHAKDCSRACQECKDRRKLEKAVEKEKEAERKAQEQRDQERHRWSIRKDAKKLLPLIEAAGLDDDDKLPGEHYWSYAPKVSEIRGFAAGDFGDKHFYNDDGLIPDTASSLMQWAEILNCSTDFLLGRSETPAPAPVSGSDTAVRWSTGTPTETGEYVIVCGAPKEMAPGSYMKTIQKWTGEGWVDTRGVPLRLNVYEWLRLPEV